MARAPSGGAAAAAYPGRVMWECCGCKSLFQSVKGVKCHITHASQLGSGAGPGAGETPTRSLARSRPGPAAPVEPARRRPPAGRARWTASCVGSSYRLILLRERHSQRQPDSEACYDFDDSDGSLPVARGGGPLRLMITAAHGTGLGRISSWESELCLASNDIDQEWDDDCGSPGQSCIILHEELEPGVQFA